jgi:predicted chitinase
MNRESLISSYIQNVYEEIQEEAKSDPVPTAGLGSKTITNVPEQEEQPVQQEKAGSILSRFLDGFKDYMRGDDDELQTTKTVRKENAAREANLEGVSILDLSLANPDGAVDGLINIPTKLTKPERAIDVQRLQDNVMQTMQTMQITKPEVDTANIDITPSTTGADGGAATDKKVVGGLMSRPSAIPLREYVDTMFETSGNNVIPNISEVKKFAKETFTNPVLAAAFVATVEAESGSGLVEKGYTKSQALKVFVERNRKKDGTLSATMQERKRRIEALPDNASGDDIFDIVYDRDNLGNTEAGDGSRYKGRGLIQITGKNNYRDIGNIIGVDLVENPELLETDKNVMLQATLAYLKENGFLTSNLTQSKLASIIGHSDDDKNTVARQRWTAAGEAYSDMYGGDMPSSSRQASLLSESLRPKERLEEDDEETVVASN